MDGTALESGVCLRFDLSQRHVRKSDLSWTRLIHEADLKTKMASGFLL